ncbi:MAG: 2,3-bisphosphoglycerate-independent phosphoglycerate mutase [Balneolaceae bacterium]
MADQPSKAILVILDGFGIAEDPSVSAIDRADTPYIDSLFQKYPHSSLSASGTSVGLPDGQFGNSEVGHLNIGAGRIVWQELSRVNQSIEEGSFFENKALTNAFRKAGEKGRIHFMGLFSDGGVHSHIEHLYALLEMAGEFNLDHAFIHAFTDGRDTSPTGGLQYCRDLLNKAGSEGIGEIASVIGRYFAMDRDKRWERTEKAYQLLVHGTGKTVSSPEEAFTASYEEDKTDEFLEPHRVETDVNSRIQKGDVVVFFNIRGDRARQILKAFLQFEEVPFETEKLDLHISSFTSYDETFAGHLHVAWPPVNLENTLGEYVGNRNLRQLRIAETEKYPHVTYFFNGGIEPPNKGEERIMIQSPKVATYDLQPEMSAAEVTEKLCIELNKAVFDLVVLNYANPDMVGHTGIMEAAVKAVETIDHELEKVIRTARENDYKILIIADHGNADCMIQPDGSAHTAHTNARVPAILIGEENVSMNEGILADVAPTLLKMMGLPQPDEMTGKPLY